MIGAPGSNGVETDVLPTGTWHHIVATLDRSGYLRGYLNGVEFGTPLDISSQSATSITSNEVANIGKDAYSNYWNGKVGDLKIYENTVLSASQVTEIYNDSKVIIPSNVSQTNLMGWWPLAEGAGTLCYDGSGNGRTGTIKNEEGDEWITGQTGCPQLVEGYNRPMFFDGSNDVVENTSVSFPTGTQSRTIAGWVWLDDATSSGGVFGYGTGPSTPYQVFEFYNYGTSIRLHYATYNSGGSTALSSKTWYHLAGTYDGTTAKVYINGALNHTDTVTLATVSSFARFGCHNYSASPGGFVKGNINEVVFYDTALSASQVADLATAGPPRNINLLTGDNASFDGGVGSWTANGGSIAASAGELVITGDGSAAGVNVLINLGGFIVGHSYIFSGYLKQGSSTNTGGHIQVYDTSGSGVDASTAFSTTGGLTDIFQKYSVEFVATATTLRLYLYKSGTDSATYIADNLTVYAAAGDPLPPDPMSLSNSSNVVGYWRNDGDVTWTDRSGEGNNGTVAGSPDVLLFKQGINGSASTSTGRDNQGFPLKYKDVGAVGFNGVDDDIVVAGTPLLSFGNGTTDSPFSMSAWINMEDASGFVIVSKGAFTVDGEWNFFVGGADNLSLELFDESVNAYEKAITQSTLTAYENTWVHVAVTYNGVGGTSANAGVTFYVNGVSQAVTLLDTGTYVAMENLGSLVRIGNRADTEYAEGSIANLQIYNRVLSQAEIKQNINAQRSRFT